MVILLESVVKEVYLVLVYLKGSPLVVTREAESSSLDGLMQHFPGAVDNHGFPVYAEGAIHHGLSWLQAISTGLCPKMTLEGPTSR